ncbi:hypothetical protein LCGC14_2886980, partial [marine sediment metagenome]
YAFGNDFKALHRAEYVRSIGARFTIHDCETAWDESVDGDVTVTVDTTYKVQGNNSNKMVIAAGASAADILATDDITEVDISTCDKVEIFIRSTVALDAGDIQLLLDDTASCASPVESIDIPATVANTSTTHTITLADPSGDTAIISVGIKLITDKGAMTLYVDRIRAVNSNQKKYEDLSADQWDVVKGSSPTFKLVGSGLSVVGGDNEIRLSGYAAPDIMSDETTDCEIDPAYVIAATTGRLLTAHAKSRQLSIVDREALGEKWLERAEKIKPYLSVDYAMNTKWV